MSYAAVGALGADDDGCEVDWEGCWKPCYHGGGVHSNAAHEACVIKCRVGPGCPAKPVDKKLLFIGGGVLVAGIIAAVVIRKRK